MPPRNHTRKKTTAPPPPPQQHFPHNQDLNEDPITTTTTTTNPAPPPSTPNPPHPTTLLLYQPHALRPNTEQGVLSFPPYTPALLPHWRFATPSLAHTSSRTLFSIYTHYEDADDWVGADMVRKFLQMGVTRARRYANYRGGRKYVVAGDKGGRTTGKRVTGDGRVDGEVGMGQEERRKVEEKLEASGVFERVLGTVKGRVWYVQGRARYWEEVGRLKEEEGWWWCDAEEEWRCGGGTEGEGEEQRGDDAAAAKPPHSQRRDGDIGTTKRRRRSTKKSVDAQYTSPGKKKKQKRNQKT